VVRDLVVFFDWVLTLPKELEERFQQKLGEMEGVMGREYVPTWERKAVHEGEKRGREEGRQEGREEGREEGRQEGRQEAVVSQIARALEKRLNGGSQPFVAAITHLTDGERTELFDLLLDTTDAEKIRAWFAVHPVKNSSRH
jgi:flagellar biosynthesis/type III secretory pathway protein FliH